MRIASHVDESDAKELNIQHGDRLIWVGHTMQPRPDQTVIQGMVYQQKSWNEHVTMNIELT